jgi:hypothetical protein
MIDPGQRNRLLDAFPMLHMHGSAMRCFEYVLDAWPDSFEPNYAALGRRFGLSGEAVRLAFRQLEAKEVIFRDGPGFIPNLIGSWSPAYREADDSSISVDPVNRNPALRSVADDRKPALRSSASVDPVNHKPGLRSSESPDAADRKPALRSDESDAADRKPGLRSPAPAHIEARARINSGGGGLNTIQSQPPPTIPPGPRDLPVDPVSGLAATEGPDGRLTPIGSLPDPKGTPEYLRLCDRAEALFPQLDFPFQIDAYRTTFPVAWIMRAVEDKGANSPRYRPKHFRPVLSLLREWQANDPPGPPPIDATPAGAGPRPYGPPAPMTPEESRAYHQRLQDEIDAREAAKEAEAAAIAAQAQAPPPGAAPTNPQALVASLAAALKDPHRGRQQAG